MRMMLRPGYNIRRSFRLAGISLHVWRRNRETASAFYDPLLDTGFLFLPSVIRRVHKRRIASALMGIAISVAVAFSVRSLPRLHLPKLAAYPIAPAIPMQAIKPVAPVPPPAPVVETKPSLVPPKPPEARPESVTAMIPVPAAVPLAAPAPAPAPVPAKFSENGFFLLACKRDRTLYVYRREGATWEKSAAYPMAVGRAFGDKVDAGDLRTPEGRFWIIGLYPGPSKGPIYGPLVFTLNYPRPGDEAEGKSGQGIWIHGTEMGKLPSYTHGCLSLANEDVMALSAYADIGTPLLVLADSVVPDPAKQMDLAGMEREYPSIISAYGRKSKQDTLAKAEALKQGSDFVAKEGREFPELSMQTLSPKDKKAILDRLQRWREDWSNRRIDEYGQNYDADFRDRDGRDKLSFLERKAKIFQSKSKIKMEIVDPQIEAEGYSRVRVSFRQDYLAEGPGGLQRSSGHKSIRMESSPAGWLIITE